MKYYNRVWKQLNLLVVLSALCISLLCGCTASTETAENTSDRPVILCTTFAAYDWVNNILGDTDTFSCELLVDTGVDLHSYQPSAQDIVRIAGCRMLVYVGGESDTWVGDALHESGNEDILAISLMELVGDRALAEVELEGVESHHHHEHDEHEVHDEAEEHDEHDHEGYDEHDHEDYDEHDHEGYDEHVWLSLRNAIVTCEALTAEISELDKTNASIYEENSQAYCKKLAELDVSYTDMMEHAVYDTILIGDRFPFLYLAEDYDIHYYAAYSGCSADAEASVDTVLFLAEKLVEKKLPVVFVTDSGMPDLAETIIECAGGNQTILNLYSMQSVTREDIEKGCTYLGYMEENMQALKSALQ